MTPADSSISAPGGNRIVMLACIALAIVFSAGAIFYFTQTTSLFADSTARHYKHAIACTALAVAAVVAANFARPKVR